jgi:hypothetical protein
MTALLCVWLAAAPEPLAWDGFDRFFATLADEGIAQTSLPEAERIFVLGEAPADPAPATLREAVRDGATLLVATERPRARPLLAAFGLTLAPEVFLAVNPLAWFDGQPDCPLITSFPGRDDLFRGVRALATNRARAVLGAGTALALFPGTGDERPAFARTLGEGRGRVIAVGDQSICINLMLGQRDNERFLRNVIGDAHSAVVYVRGRLCRNARDAAAPPSPLDGPIPIPDLAPNVQDLNALLADLQDAAPMQTLNAQAFPVLCCLLGMLVVWTFLRCILGVWLPPRRPFGAARAPHSTERPPHGH